MVKIIQCFHCQKDFECSTRRWNDSIKFGKTKLFCSKECYGKSREKFIILDCHNCGKEVKATPGKIRRSQSGQVFCSRSCSNGKHNELRIGDKHPNFNNYVRQYRRIKLENSKIECEVCKIDDIRVLEVHHKDRNRKNSNLDNLQLLCANCHLIIHSKIAL